MLVLLLFFFDLVCQKQKFAHARWIRHALQIFLSKGQIPEPFVIDSE